MSGLLKVSSKKFHLIHNEKCLPKISAKNTTILLIISC